MSYAKAAVNRWKKMLPAVALAVTGCMPGALVTKSATGDPSAAYVCAQRALGTLGFTVTDSNPSKRFIAGQRLASTAKEIAADHETYFTTLDIAIYTDADNRTKFAVKPGRLRLVGNAPLSGDGVTVTEWDDRAADSLTALCTK